MLRFAKQSPGVGGTVVQQLMGGRDVAPLGADVRVPRAMPVGLHMKSAPALIRTGDTRFRKPLLFHTELLGRLQDSD